MGTSLGQLHRACRCVRPGACSSMSRVALPDLIPQEPLYPEHVASGSGSWAYQPPQEYIYPVQPEGDWIAPQQLSPLEHFDKDALSDLHIHQHESYSDNTGSISSPMSDASLESLPAHESVLPTSSTSSIANWNVYPSSHHYQHHDTPGGQHSHPCDSHPHSSNSPVLGPDVGGQQLGYPSEQHIAQEPVRYPSPGHRRSRHRSERSGVDAPMSQSTQQDSGFTEVSSFLRDGTSHRHALPPPSYAIVEIHAGCFFARETGISAADALSITLAKSIIVVSGVPKLTPSFTELTFGFIPNP
ncbi:hypothetical protein BXZ70DRAFT_698343 [Cristinia sonorae]|uniref:Uncharacterized protein n=1 Tax=Cristinia sonorae TaxID=1940300 RepID=A0A8K0UFQ2_9AGAR|nr:hypothetical protein BXZ70DRAFT_698343 [Cristinia sonorae]